MFLLERVRKILADFRRILFSTKMPNKYTFVFVEKIGYLNWDLISNLPNAFLFKMYFLIGYFYI